MRKFISFSTLSLLLILAMTACDSVSVPNQPTTNAPSSLVSPTAIPTPNHATTTSTKILTTTAAITTTPSSNLPEVETDLGPLPINCPVSQLTYKELSPRFASGTAGPGLWAVGLQNKIQMSAGQLAQQYTEKYGWAIKVLWVVEPGQNEPITLNGYSLSDNQPVWFSTDKVGTSAVFPANSSSSDYGEYPSNIFFAKAGCYDLVAKWNGGGWKITVAIGHQ